MPNEFLESFNYYFNYSEMNFWPKKIAERGEVNGIIALGAVIKGATSHFEYVAGECAAGLARVSHEFTLPISFGVQPPS